MTSIMCPFCKADVVTELGCEGMNQSCPVSESILRLGSASCEYCRRGAPLTAGRHRPTGKGGPTFQCTALRAAPTQESG